MQEERQRSAQQNAVHQNGKTEREYHIDVLNTKSALSREEHANLLQRTDAIITVVVLE